MTELELTKDIIIAFLSKYQTPAGLVGIYEINTGNKKCLLDHITALIEIFNKAKEQLEGDKNEWNNRRSNAWRAAESRAQ